MLIQESNKTSDKTKFGETMGLKETNEIEPELKFIYLQNTFLTNTPRRMICNDLIQLNLTIH